ncbi:hypothetical protein [Geotalea sp. SG265]|uniref:hypothetical protein n=1 Tax=Geotalea sp. SG265 TaxID=2922867 RepID=UPI001FAF615B|nr:hypothetical protein [Geotalea sp. SG265]
MSGFLNGVINEALHNSSGESNKNSSLLKQANDAISKNDNSESNRKEELSQYNYGKARSNGMIVTEQQHEKKSQERGTDQGLKGIKNVDDYKKEIDEKSQRKLENHSPHVKETNRTQTQGKDAKVAPKAVADYKKAIAAKNSSKKGHYEQQQRKNSFNKGKANNIKYDRQVANSPAPKGGSGRSK